MKRVIFMGTPSFAVPTLQAFLARHDVVALFCQSDKPKNRGQNPAPCETKIFVQKNFPHIPIFSPEKFDAAHTKIINDLAPDFIIVVAYGKILPRAVISHRCINLHGSILPRHRGASPLQSMILHADPEFGVTAMKMDEKMDHGEILDIFRMPNDGRIGISALSEILAERGAEMMIRVVENYENLTPQPQNHALATFCKKIDKNDGLINFCEDTAILAAKSRAFESWPQIFLGSGLKIFGLRENDKNLSQKPGEILKIDKISGEITIGCARGTVTICELQAPGKKRLRASDFLNGRGLKIGQILK